MSENGVNDPFMDLMKIGHPKSAAKKHEIYRIISITKLHNRKRFDQKGICFQLSAMLLMALLLIILLPDYILTQPVSAASDPMADFSASPTSSCSSPLTVTFTDTSTGGNGANGQITKWDWNFNGDSIIDGTNTTAPSPFAHTYNTPGTYTVMLTVTINQGKTNTMTKTSYITAYGPPTANFTASPNSGCSPLTVAFVDSSNGNGRIITGWAWDFGDSTTYNGQTPPTHIYSNRGTYTVKLTVTSACGSNTRMGYVTVSSQPVVVPGTYGPACVSGGNITLVGSPGGGTWFGDGVSGNVFNPSAAGPGNHVLTYQYKSGSSFSFSNTTILTVVPLPQTKITVG